jgi:hypothetical protein
VCCGCNNTQKNDVELSFRIALLGRFCDGLTQGHAVPVMEGA